MSSILNLGLLQLNLTAHCFSVDDVREICSFRSIKIDDMDDTDIFPFLFLKVHSFLSYDLYDGYSFGLIFLVLTYSVDSA